MRNQSDCVLIQQASGEYKHLLGLTVQRHLAYCFAHDMDYWPIFGEARPDNDTNPPHYDRVWLIEKALEAGYASVIWLDADCVITGDKDLRGGVPEKGIGALWCESKWENPAHYDHWCTGALYIQNTGLTCRGFFNDWRRTHFTGHGWVDQHAFNGLVQGDYYKGIVHPVSRHWHAIVPDFMPEDGQTPQVIAFHGFGDLQTRYNAIAGLLERGKA